MDAPENTSEISKFFQGRSVLITGCTGFVGKVILEKLIRSCPKVETVFILIRPKPGSDVHARLKKLLDNVLFDSIRKIQPSGILKIRPISGDITLPELGISIEDRKVLCQNVSVVIHSAASTNFNGKIRNSFKINIKGTQQVVDLSKEMSKLVAFVHISTAYTNCERLNIDEIVYPMSVGAKKLELMLEEMSDVGLEAVKEELFGTKRNTYVFTKAMLEDMLNEESQKLPVCIVRPSIVAPTYREPMPGWADDNHGYIFPARLFGMGLARTAHARGDIAVDFVPVDLFASFVLAVAWELGTSNTKTLRIYNYCSSGPNQMTTEAQVQLVNKIVVENPIPGVMWYPHLTIIASKRFLNLIEFFQIYLPAMFLDGTRLLMGKKPKLVGFYRLYLKLRDATEYFRMNQFNFATDNMTKLYKQMGKSDRELFDFRLQNIDFKHYIESGVRFGRKHILKATEADVEAARSRIKILYVAHRSVQALFVATVIFCLICILQFAFSSI